jgi:uncharacterized membrane protein
MGGHGATKFHQQCTGWKFLQEIAISGCASRSGRDDEGWSDQDSEDPHPSKLLPWSALIGAVASARSVTPRVTLSAARLLAAPLLALSLCWTGRYSSSTPMGAGELAGDKLRSAPDRSETLGSIARVSSAWTAGAALARRGTGACGCSGCYCYRHAAGLPTMDARKRAMRHVGQTRTGLVEDLLCDCRRHCGCAGGHTRRASPSLTRAGHNTCPAKSGAVSNLKCNTAA